MTRPFQSKLFSKTITLLLISIVMLCLAVLGFWPSNNSSRHKTSNRITSPSGLTVIVNKNYPLRPKRYIPVNLVIPNIPLRDNITDDEKHVSSLIAGQLEKMFGTAQQDGILLNLQSGYRSYEFQQRLYDQYVQSQGKASADMYSARPGYSEHQTGLAVDIGSVTDTSCNVRSCFANTPESNWLAKNAQTFGFIIRYPNGKQEVTGYSYEPWHLRYVGVNLATNIHDQSGMTLEEYFDVR